MARVRVRQHVNPLSSRYQQFISPPDWTQIYGETKLPLHLDIGCGRGRFLLQMASLKPDWNFLGLEIREPLVEEANGLRDEKGLKNLHYLFCNVNTSAKVLLESFPKDVLQFVSIQFPDPWFKKRHHKRRIVQPELVQELAIYLTHGGEIFLQSDIEAIAAEMQESFASHPAFCHQGDSQFAENPLPLATERERATLLRGKPVYRALFKKVN